MSKLYVNGHVIVNRNFKTTRKNLSIRFKKVIGKKNSPSKTCFESAVEQRITMYRAHYTTDEEMSCPAKYFFSGMYSTPAITTRASMVLGSI